MKEPKIAIVILTYNGFGLTKECLESFSRINYLNKEIFLVDNCSQKIDEFTNLKKLSKYYNYLIRITGYNRGFSGGMNFGARSVIDKDNYKYILLCSNDIIPKKDFLNKLMQVMENDKKIGIAGPLQYFYNKKMEYKKICFAGSIITPITNKTKHITQINDKPKLDYIIGSVFLIKKDCFLQLNGYDEDYYNWYEDCDLSMRAKKLGWKLALASDSIVWHKVAQTVGRNTNEYILHSIFYHSRNRIIFVKKNRSKIEYYTFLFYLLCYETPIFIIRKIKTRKTSLLKFNLKIIKEYYRGIFNALFFKSNSRFKERIPSK
jgi:GT2 family glycosyltransferase